MQKIIYGIYDELQRKEIAMKKNISKKSIMVSIVFLMVIANTAYFAPI